MNMHINILERQQLTSDGLSTFHIHNPVQPILHQKAFSNMAISLKTFSHVRVRELVIFMANSKKQMAWHGDRHISERIQILLIKEQKSFSSFSLVLSCTKKH